MTATFAYNDAKFKELLLYVAQQSVDDASFGKTKLNKILYYVDSFAYGILGRPVTGATYVRRPYGPVPQQITTALAELDRSNDLTIETQQRFNYTQARPKNLRPADPSQFDTNEFQLINEVLRALKDRTAVEVSEISHRELGWILAKDREVIPYEAFLISPDPSTADDTYWAQTVYKEINEAA